MAHLVENMISTKNLVPWHGVGVVTPKELVTAQEIIKAIGFDYKVAKRVNQTGIHIDGKMTIVELEDSFSMIRINKDKTESVLSGRVGRNYTPIQNVDAFKFFDKVVGSGEAIYETAGILKNGRTIFILACLPEYIKILGSEEDTIKKYVLLANWHDGTSQLICQFTDVRVVCNNTLNMALRSQTNQIQIRHTKNSDEKLHEASRVMGMVNKYNMEIEKVFNKMALTKITNDQLMTYINGLMPIDEKASDVAKKHRAEKVNQLVELVEVGAGANLDTAKGTVWGAYNAYVELIDHNSGFRSDESRTNSLLVGVARTKKQEAFDQALELTERFRPISNN